MGAGLNRYWVKLVLAIVYVALHFTVVRQPRSLISDGINSLLITCTSVGAKAKNSVSGYAQLSDGTFIQIKSPLGLYFLLAIAGGLLLNLPYRIIGYCMLVHLALGASYLLILFLFTCSEPALRVIEMFVKYLVPVGSVAPILLYLMQKRSHR